MGTGEESEVTIVYSVTIRMWLESLYPLFYSDLVASAFPAVKIDRVQLPLWIPADHFIFGLIGGNWSDRRVRKTYLEIHSRQWVFSQLTKWNHNAAGKVSL